MEVEEREIENNEHSLPELVGRLRAARKEASRFVEYRTTRAEVVDAVRMLDEAADEIERLRCINDRERKCGPNCDHTAEEHWAFDFGYDMGYRIGETNTINPFRKGVPEWEAFDYGVSAGNCEYNSSNASDQGRAR